MALCRFTKLTARWSQSPPCLLKIADNGIKIWLDWHQSSFCRICCASILISSHDTRTQPSNHDSMDKSSHKQLPLAGFSNEESTRSNKTGRVMEAVLASCEARRRGIPQLRRGKGNSTEGPTSQTFTVLSHRGPLIRPKTPVSGPLTGVREGMIKSKEDEMSLLRGRLS